MVNNMNNDTTNMDTIENAAQKQFEIAEKFHFGHNMLRSTVTFQQFFTQISTILEPVLAKYTHDISDINFGPYSESGVSRGKINICWWQLTLAESGEKMARYFILLNPVRGAVYTALTDDDITALLLDGRNSHGWYLINQIECLNEFITKGAAANIIFERILRELVNKLFKNHEDTHSIAEHYLSQYIREFKGEKDIDFIIDSLQTQTSSNSTADTREHYIYSKSTSLRTLTARENIKPLDLAMVPDIINSTYLDRKFDTAAFISNALTENASNIYFFYSHASFNDGVNRSFLDNNYSVNTQLTGKFKLKYSDGSTDTVPPSSQAIVLNKTPDEIFFVIMLYSPSFLAKTVSDVNPDEVLLNYKISGAV